MSESTKRVVLKLEIAGQSTEISRTVSAETHWDDVTDVVVREFTRGLLESALASLAYDGDRQPLTVRQNPTPPSDEEINTLFDLARGEPGTGVELGIRFTRGLKAVWRHGCDAGMVAP